MNIFVLDLDHTLCAQYHVDKHVVKMILETTQLLNTAISFLSPQHPIPYRPTHCNHPATIWTRASRANFDWLQKLGLALFEEYQFRYGKSTHKCFCHLQSFQAKDFSFPREDLTPFAQCMPEAYRGPDPVAAYRQYYQMDKRDLATWTKRGQPEWWIDT